MSESDIKAKKDNRTLRRNDGRDRYRNCHRPHRADWELADSRVRRFGSRTVCLRRRADHDGASLGRVSTVINCQVLGRVRSRSMSLSGVKRTCRCALHMTAIDLGCVKTQKFAKRRELFFSDQAKANPHTNCRDSNCGSEKRSFYRRRALLRFHTAKTRSGRGAA
jgi:hypothetical protein